MLISARNAIYESISDLGKVVTADLSGRFEIPVGAVCLAAALSVLDGYPRLVALSLVSLCSLSSIARRPD